MATAWLATVAAGVMALGLGAATAQAQAQVQPQPPVQQAPPREDFASWLAAVKSDAQAHGISQTTLDTALSDLQPIDRVLELDRKQPEFTLTFEEYLDHVVNPTRVETGRLLLADQKRVLAAVAKRFGVPAPVVVAMWGIESDYGRLTGNFSVVAALATLAYDGRRSQYFRGELMNSLRMIEAGVPAERMRGSWAGAMGQCQFMPSTYLKYARSFEGPGQPDIWGTPPDVFASAANYLSQIGWDGRQRWGRAVMLPEHGIAPALFGLETKLSLKEWKRLGLRLPDGKPLPVSNLQASLVRAETGKGDDVGRGPPYLVYDNFRVLMKWNRSVFFALAAGTLADRLASK